MDPNQFKKDFTDTVDISDMDVRGRVLSNVKVSNPNDIDCLGLVLYDCYPINKVRNALLIGDFKRQKSKEIIILKALVDIKYDSQHIENVKFEEISLIRCSFRNTTFVNVSFEGCSIECCDFINCEFTNCTFDSYYIDEEPYQFLWMMSCNFTGSTFENCYFWGDVEYSVECDPDRESTNVFDDITVILGDDPRNTF